MREAAATETRGARRPRTAATETRRGRNGPGRGTYEEATRDGRLLLGNQKVNFLDVVAFEVLVFEDDFVEDFDDFFEEDEVAELEAGAALEAR